MQNELNDLSAYKILEKLGAGSQAEAFLVYNNKTQQKYVLKRYKKANLRNQRAELQILQGLRHQHVVRYFTDFESNQYFNILLQYANAGSLQRELDERRRLGQMPPYREQEVFEAAKQLLSALTYLHRRQVVHRDVKPDNILQNKENGKISYLLCDFGVAKTLQNLFTSTQVGTFFYLSPQVLNNKPYTSKTDVWSLGVVLHQMLTGHLIFDVSNFNVMTIVQQISNYKYQRISTVSPQFNFIMERMLQVDEGARFSSTQLYELILYLEKLSATKTTDLGADIRILKMISQNYDRRYSVPLQLWYQKASERAQIATISRYGSQSQRECIQHVLECCDL